MDLQDYAYIGPTAANWEHKYNAKVLFYNDSSAVIDEISSQDNN